MSTKLPAKPHPPLDLETVGVDASQEPHDGSAKSSAKGQVVNRSKLRIAMPAVLPRGTLTLVTKIVKAIHEHERPEHVPSENQGVTFSSFDWKGQVKLVLSLRATQGGMVNGIIAEVSGSRDSVARQRELLRAVSRRLESNFLNVLNGRGKLLISIGPGLLAQEVAVDWTVDAFVSGLRTAAGDFDPTSPAKIAARKQVEKQSVGVETEGWLFNKENRRLAAVVPDELFDELQAKSGGRVVRESKPNQVEIITSPHQRPETMRDEMTELRSLVTETASRYDLDFVIMAVPPGLPSGRIGASRGAYYEQSMRKIGQPQRQKFISATHVHGGTFSSDETRIQLQNTVRYLTPLFVAMSAGSPFALEDGRLVDYASTRRLYIACLPRHGLSPHFESHRFYVEVVDELLRSRAIDQRSEIWWDLRPSDRHPTLEIRCLDALMDVDLELSIAWTYRALLEALACSEDYGAGLIDPCHDVIIEEDLTHAARMGMAATLRNPFTGVRTTAHQVVQHLITEVADFACDLGSLEVVESLPNQLVNGGPAHCLREIYQSAALHAWLHGADENRAHKDGLNSMIEFVTRRSGGASEPLPTSPTASKAE